VRTVLITLWLFLPLVALAYHYGPGQERLELDRADDRLEAARALAADGRHGEAVEAFDEALRHLPDGSARAARPIRLEKAKSQMLSSGLPDARADLVEIVAELEDDAAADRALLADARRSLASAHYYTTWLMRLEGQPRDAWEPEVDAARQHYRLLVEQAEAPGERTRREQDLAAAVRLARMDLDELQGLPLPSQ